ncbi:glycosyl hydrolase 2 galactose-binding domain-containing protein [Rhodococcus sp. MEB064]|uniref:glycosyl hydrolase 2 galactose-binding domain-containing protein n=1 Tax=Rhodococcus sp. MEB064 TaxID=1587522 RepID=UPI0005ABD2EF|nr:hypothetical protein [Rhodococcus sp. MEB064]KIQ11800.1 hypothetical protein RU01_18590 [Rhodococcus sp. MEB064]
MTDPFVGARWEIVGTESGACESPSDVTGAAVVAVVPGTVAAALGPSVDAVLDARDWWYRSTVMLPAGPVVITFDGLATVAEVWLDGELSARSESMFVPVSVELDRPEAGPVRVDLVFRALDDVSTPRRPRARWRSSMLDRQSLRWIRTSVLGRAPVFVGAPAPVGPWRPVHLDAPADRRLRVTGTQENGIAVLVVRGTATPGQDLAVSVAGSEHTVTADADGTVDASFPVPDAQPWWPHTHGTPRLYEVRVDGVRLYDTGFREITFDADSGALTVNGVEVFCRGACWVPLDVCGLQNDPGALGAAIESLILAGSNMIRCTGTMVYEDEAFYDACSRAGILVWQDVMITTVDLPDTDEVRSSVVEEVRSFLRRTAHHPAVVVLSGGSETHQQPTMLGLESADAALPLQDSIIADVVRTERPDSGYVPSSPHGGALATHVGSGVAHYFGVGGYLQPLSDLRRASVGFAAECLAFAVPPERRAVDEVFGSAAVAGHHPDWKAAIPRDRGSSWDFEDVRDHYVRTIFGVEPTSVRRDDPELYLDYGRAAVCEATTAAYDFWRGSLSRCHGALVLTYRDTAPGAGWGFTDSSGGRKAPWWALARSSQPVTVLVTDEGMDGLRLEVINDGESARTLTLDVRAHTRVGVVAAEGRRDILVDAHASVVLTVDEVLGRFTDATHVHRFGARTFDAISASIADGESGPIAERVYLVDGPALPRQNDVGLTAIAGVDESGRRYIDVSTRFAAQYVCVDLDGWLPQDNWFTLAPGTTRRIMLTALGAGDRAPSGHVRALNAEARARIES